MDSLTWLYILILNLHIKYLRNLFSIYGLLIIMYHMISEMIVSNVKFYHVYASIYFYEL